MIKQDDMQAKTLIHETDWKSFANIIAHSPMMKFTLEQGKLATQSSQVLFLRGEEGTGKRLMAKAIHHSASNSSECPFITIHSKKDKQALDALLLKNSACNGTVYLEDVTFLTLQQQEKLLEIIQSHYSQTQTYRLILASSSKLEKEMINGRFREDLYMLLMKWNIYLPSLSERKEDIEPLTRAFIDLFNEKYNRSLRDISEEGKKYLLELEYVANVEELKTILQLAILRTVREETILRMKHLVMEEQNIKQPSFPPFEDEGTLSEQVERFEKVIIANKLQSLDGNKTLTAKSLGLSVRNLYYKLDKYGLN